MKIFALSAQHYVHFLPSRAQKGPQAAVEAKDAIPKEDFMVKPQRKQHLQQFDDCDRIIDYLAVNNKRRHHAYRVELFVVGLFLIVCLQIDIARLVVDRLQRHD